MVSYKALNTVSKSAITNTYHTIWNNDADERLTIYKSFVTNTYYTIWNVDATNGCTSPKSIISNPRHTIRNDTVCFFRSVRNKNSFIFIK